jgi:hypothetical protein
MADGVVMQPVRRPLRVVQIKNKDGSVASVQRIMQGPAYQEKEPLPPMTPKRHSTPPHRQRSGSWAAAERQPSGSRAAAERQPQIALHQTGCRFRSL